jgi:hypothetical protein
MITLIIIIFVTDWLTAEVLHESSEPFVEPQPVPPLHRHQVTCHVIVIIIIIVIVMMI